VVKHLVYPRGSGLRKPVTYGKPPLLHSLRKKPEVLQGKSNTM
jgi:hypothetical protein